MTSAVPVLVCEQCGAALFPARLLCPRCGGSRWREEPVDAGVVEETTVVRRAPGGLRRPVLLGSVRLAAGPVVIARLEPGVEAGARVRVSMEGGVPVAAWAGMIAP